MTLEKAFGMVLVESRKKANLSQEALAYECGLDRTYISLLERGRRQPTLKTLFLIVKCQHIVDKKMCQDIVYKISSLTIE